MLGTGKKKSTSINAHAFKVCAVTPYDGRVQAGVVSCSVTYSMAWRRQRCPIRRWMERLLDLSSDDPGEQWEKEMSAASTSELFHRSVDGDVCD